MPLGQDLVNVVDPFKLKELLWPNVRFYRQQNEIIESVWYNDETFVPAGNMLGKDFVAGFICLAYFLGHPTVRVVTTSVKDDHLRVLWGEIGRYVQTSAYPLVYGKGGPFIIKHRDIRKVVAGKECKISYLLGMVSERGEGMAGHHAPYALGVIDEASGVDDHVYTQMDTWSKRKLVFGNPNMCVTGKEHFFYKGCKSGDLIDQPELQSSET